MIAPPTTAAPTPYPQPGPRQPPPPQPGPRQPGPPRQPPPPPQPRPPQPTVSMLLGTTFLIASAPDNGAADAALVTVTRLAASSAPATRAGMRLIICYSSGFAPEGHQPHARNPRQHCGEKAQD